MPPADCRMAADVCRRRYMTPDKRWTLIAAVLGSSIVFLDSSVLTVALPAIGQQPRLFVSVLEGQNYVQYGYLLTLSALLVLAGALSDFYGRKKIFVIGLVLLRHRLLRVRHRPERRVPDPRPTRPGCRRRDTRARLAGHPGDQFPGRGAGPRVRRLGSGIGHRADHRPVHWRPARRRAELALDLHHQRAAHPGRAVGRPAPHQGES